MRFGAGPSGVMRTLGQYMVGSAATFGWVAEHKYELLNWFANVFSFFMSIGSVIRTDSSPMAMEAFAKAQRRPIIVPRRFPRNPVEES